MVQPTTTRGKAGPSFRVKPLFQTTRLNKSYLPHFPKGWTALAALRPTTASDLDAVVMPGGGSEPHVPFLGTAHPRDSVLSSFPLRFVAWSLKHSTKSGEHKSHSFSFVRQAQICICSVSKCLRCLHCSLCCLLVLAGVSKPHGGCTVPFSMRSGPHGCWHGAGCAVLPARMDGEAPCRVCDKCLN